jgi:hypothetical protein
MRKGKRKERKVEADRRGDDTSVKITLAYLSPRTKTWAIISLENIGHAHLLNSNGSLRAITNYWEIKYS